MKLLNKTGKIWQGGDTVVYVFILKCKRDRFLRSRIVNRCQIWSDAIHSIIFTILHYLVLQKATHELQNLSHWLLILTPSLSHILPFSEAELKESVTQRATRQTCDISRGSINASALKLQHWCYNINIWNVSNDTLKSHLGTQIVN